MLVAPVASHPLCASDFQGVRWLLVVAEEDPRMLEVPSQVSLAAPALLHLLSPWFQLQPSCLPEEMAGPFYGLAVETWPRWLWCLPRLVVEAWPWLLWVPLLVSEVPQEVEVPGPSL